MSIRKIVHLPDPRLRKIAKPVEDFGASFQTLINDMFDTMYHANGVGLAAPQIGIDLSVSVIDVIGDKKHQIVIANPEIIHAEGSLIYQEGCLSIPGAYDKVTRAQKVTVKAQDRFGKFFEKTGENLLAECFQHEIDHLNGKLFIDLLSPLKRNIIRKKSEKFRRLQEKRS